MSGRQVFLSLPTYVLGQPRPVTAASINDSDDAAATFAADGYATVHQSSDPCWKVAAEAAALATARAQPDTTVYCTETWFEMAPTDALSRFVTALGVGAFHAVALGGHACANFLEGIDLATRELANGRSTALVATVDRVADGRSRTFQDGLALLSDAAAACLVSDQPLGSGYTLLAQARRNNSTIDEDGSEVVHVRRSIGDTRASAVEVLEQAGVSQADVRWLVMNNYRTASNDFVAASAGFGNIPRARPTTVSVAHCFAADSAITLNDLAVSGSVQDGDLVLVLGSGGRTRNAALLRAVLPGAPAVTEGAPPTGGTT